MSHELGLVAVAEGIETEDQLAVVRELGCDLGQGFLLAVPLRAEECDLSAPQPGVYTHPPTKA